MIPVTDNYHIRIKPIVCYFLIGVNLVLFLWLLKLEVSGELANFVRTWGIVPARFAGAYAAVLSGNSAAFVVAIGSTVSLFTGMFLHGSFSQILANLLFLWVFGSRVENYLGHWRFAAIYLLSGLLASVVQVLVDPSLNVPLVGANGAIASILGAYVFLFPKSKIYSVLPLFIAFIPVELPVFFYLFWWFVQQSFYWIGSLDVPGGINSIFSLAYWAHGLGLIFGVGGVKLVQRL